ncbi:MAG TPA: ROK family protein [Ancylobacter sp.]
MSDPTIVPAPESAPPVVAVHGASRLTAVNIDAYNSLLREDDGFVGDRARRAAFFEILDRWRELANGQDHPIVGDAPTPELSKKTLDEAFADGTPQEQALILSAVEDYAGELVTVIKRFMRSKEWRDTERIAIGGGLKSGRFAEIAIARAELLLRAGDLDIELRPIRNEPDEAGLIGTTHLAPSWMFGNFDNILAIDIGGTNMRAGIIRLNLEKATDLSKARVRTMELWRHGDDDEMKRDEAIDRLVDMLKDLIRQAEKDDISLAPFIGIGCPGEILHDGSIETGAQNLPGNWESARFNLPHAIWEAIPAIDGRETTVIMHNDAVVQGLSETPFMQDVTRWGVLTIGTGLGNARFTNRTPLDKKSEKEKPAKDKSKSKNNKD